MLGSPDVQRLCKLVSAEAGLVCEGIHGVDDGGQAWCLLQPADQPTDHAFAIRTTIEWRRTRISFEPGQFAADLLAEMGRVDATGRSAFRSIVRQCLREKASIEFRVNGESCDPEDTESWPSQWSRLALSLTARLSPVGDDESSLDINAAFRWTGRFAAAVVTLLPVDNGGDDHVLDGGGYAEGAASLQRSTRYERDPRNRAAAITYWGTRCQACGLDFGVRYGEVAAGFIEVHHTTPVSRIAPGTIVDPERDLVPLCPNCHAVAHRREPPFTVKEIQDMLGVASRVTS